MKKKDITSLYNQWRKENNNQKPNRIIVRIQWEDDLADGNTESYVDTLGMKPDPYWGPQQLDDASVLWYAGTLDDLWELTKPDNGSDFIVVEVLEFWKLKRSDLVFTNKEKRSNAL